MILPIPSSHFNLGLMETHPAPDKDKVTAEVYTMPEKKAPEVGHKAHPQGDM